MSRPRKVDPVPVFSTLDLTYLALRAGPVDTMQLNERIGTCTAAHKLVRMGHAVAASAGKGGGAVFRLTPAGRAACPSRRALEREVTMAYDDRVRP